MWRHHCDEWGNLCNDDKAANGSAHEQGDRILSCYTFIRRQTVENAGGENPDAPKSPKIPFPA